MNQQVLDGLAGCMNKVCDSARAQKLYGVLRDKKLTIIHQTH